MTVTITYSGATPTVGADEEVWGGEINSALGAVKVDLDALAVQGNANQSAITTLQGQVTGLAAAITGEIKAWPATAVPTGYLECNGAAVSRTTYAALYTVLGGVWGSGDGSTTFNLPDLRGEFIRGWDNSRGVDPGRAFATNQADELEAHTHTVAASQDDTPNTAIASGSGSISAFVTTSSTGGTETRPRNVAMKFIIKT